MFSPKFVLKGNLQARARVPVPVPPPLPRSRPAVHGARGDVCHAAPPACTRVCSSTELGHARVARTCRTHTRFRPRVWFNLQLKAPGAPEKGGGTTSGPPPE